MDIVSDGIVVAATLRGAAEARLTEAWLCAFQFCGGDPLTLNVIVPLIIMVTVYWATGTFFTVVDMCGGPDWVARFKIPDSNPTKYPRLTPSKLYSVVCRVIVNQTLVAVPVIYLCYKARRILGHDDGLSLPALQRFVFDIAFQVLTEEAFFYYSHRLLHRPSLYKRYHKKHHEWISPVGVSAIYCHPVEHILSNVLPTYMGSVLFGAHVTSLWVWLTFATFYGVTVHSGYHLPFTPSPEFHHYHHLKFNENFGVAGLLDWLHGTDRNFRKSKAYARNKVLLSLTPLHP